MHGPHPLYMAMGDLIYCINADCIRSYYRAYFLLDNLTEFMRYCNAEFRACRQHIEISSGKGDNLFKITESFRSFKLAQSNLYSVELLRMSHFLVNIYNILRGNSSSGYDQFDIATLLTNTSAFNY